MLNVKFKFKASLPFDILNIKKPPPLNLSTENQHIFHPRTFLKRLRNVFKMKILNEDLTLIKTSFYVLHRLSFRNVYALFTFKAF